MYKKKAVSKLIKYVCVLKKNLIPCYTNIFGKV